MRDPELTRDRILKKAGILFNTQGYKATSISNITDLTGFTKGAIYKHFRDKEDLERESLAHLSELMFENVRVVIKKEPTAGRKLRAIFHYFESYITDPPLKGGCPLLNAAVEADDTSPVLRREASKILNILRQSVIAILDNGIQHKQIKSSIDKEFFATIVIASLEGAIMMGKLQGNDDDVKRVIRHLDQQLNEIEL
ncbi:MAG TPA: TetR/AcrR family transcriptional regulator [Cyclobacteriaceae bacterium]|nr:TetR/AcrR family transcriptional regulator [Cyclobacteriaceae bacterium]